MTRITQFILGTHDDLEISTFGDAVLGFGFEIREGEHHRVIIDCKRSFPSPEKAEDGARALIEACKKAVAA
jgi:hypothetical protein